MKATIYLFFSVLLLPIFSFAQCPDCGNGAQDGSETHLSCPSDVPHPATCASPCDQPKGAETVQGIRKSLDFVGTTTYSTSGLPPGWSFGGATSATTATTLPVADVFGPKGGLVQPSATGSTTTTNGNGFCIGSIGGSTNVGLNGENGKLGANFDGRPNVNQNQSYAILRGSGNPTLVSETYNMTNVEGFKIQFWVSPSETSCGRSLAWSCTGNAAFLDFSSNGGSTWTQILRMENTTSEDNCTAANTNYRWIKQGQWTRVCLTVYKENTSTGNYYSAAGTGTAAQGMMVNSAYFSSNFKFRIRYVQSASCNETPTTTNPGRYLAIDYPVVTSGNEMIPCGISFINTCGYGQDNNDDGVGSSTATTTATAFGTVKRSVNHSERGVELFYSQNSTFGTANLSGSNFANDHILCNAEGGDKQCINWLSNNNSYMAVYECVTDWETSDIQLAYYKDGAAASTTMSKVTGAGKTPEIGWRHSVARYINCSMSDLNPGCNGYLFRSGSLPNTGFARAFYSLSTDNLGRSWSVYGATSCSHYYNGPTLAPIAIPEEVTPNSNFLVCEPAGVRITADVDFCATSGFTGTGSIDIMGPGFAESINAGATSSLITTAGEYTLHANVPNTPTQCLDCGRNVCITISQAEIDLCMTVLPVELVSFNAQLVNGNTYLNWNTETEVNSSHFTVERSTDGIYFDRIGQVKAAGMSNQPMYYDLTDKSTPTGISYYRLKMVDLDGISRYSNAVSINKDVQILQVIPNPSSGSFQINGLNVGELIEIIDAQGKQVYHTKATQKEMNLNTTLEAGVYLLKINNQTIRIVIQ